jgi:predicted nucleic acid-binding protein
MFIYLDNSALNRPFDDQKQPRIWLETLALSLILQMVEAGEIDLVKSPVHFMENDESPFVLRRQWVEHCLHLARREAGLDESVKSRARDLQRAGLKPLDALHVSCAEAAGGSHFLTCDDRLIRRYAGKIAVLNPLDFVLELNRQTL